MNVRVSRIDLRTAGTVWAEFLYGEFGFEQSFTLPLVNSEVETLVVGQWYEIDFTAIPDPTEPP